MHAKRPRRVHLRFVSRVGRRFWRQNAKLRNARLCFVIRLRNLIRSGRISRAEMNVHYAHSYVMTPLARHQRSVPVFGAKTQRRRLIGRDRSC